MYKHFEEFNIAVLLIDPKTPIDQFSEKLNSAFKKFQKNIGISEENLVRIENLVIFPAIHDEEGNLVRSTVNSKLPENITLGRIWKMFGSSYGPVKIDGKDYFMDTKDLDRHFVDSDGRLIIAPFFFKPDVLSTDSIEKKIISAKNFLSPLMTEFFCKPEDQPQLKPDQISKTAEFLENFFRKFVNSEKSFFPTENISYQQMWSVLQAVESLKKHGFSPLQLINASAPTCKPRISGEGLFSFSMINSTDRKFPFSACYSGGTISFVGSSINYKAIILHEILHSFNDRHLDSYKFLENLLEKGNQVPITLLNAGEFYSTPISHQDLGALDITLIAMAKQLSSLNHGKNFEAIQKCYQPLETRELKKLLQCYPDESIYSDSFSDPNQHEASGQEETPDSQFIKRLKDQILLIEAPAILARTLAEVFGNLLKYDDKKTEVLASYAENTSRLVSIGSHYGIRSLVNSLALPLIMTTAKLTESIIENAGYTPPSERFDNLMENFSGYQALKIMGKFYQRQPEIVKSFINQALFVSLLYTSCELLERNTENEEYKDSQKLSFGESLALHFTTSMASGVLKILGSNLAKSIKSYMSSSRESSGSTPAIGDAENPESSASSQNSGVSPDVSPRNSGVSQVGISADIVQSRARSS
jgi:hypothetical protein